MSKNKKDGFGKNPTTEETALGAGNEIAAGTPEPVEEKPAKNQTDISIAAADAQDSVPASDESSAETAGSEYFAEDGKEKKKRIKRKDMTPEQKKKRRIKDLIISGSVFATVGIFLLTCTLVGFVGRQGNYKRIENIQPVNYASPFALETDDETGYQTLVGDGDLRIMQLTDIHIGAGAFSAKKDSYAIAAVAELMQRMKPDLVIVTGDIAYPVPFQAGTLNNKREAEMFATLMEKLGVYWTVAFGNHDTENYSTHDREEISKIYSDSKWEKCLFRSGLEDIYGYGNDVILIKNTSGEIVQSIVTLDSNAYAGSSLKWEYDKIRDDQVEWYKAEMNKISAQNIANGYGAVKSLLFFHIPLLEYKIAWDEYKNNGYNNTDDVTYYSGKAGEPDEAVYHGDASGILFDAMLEVGGQGTFCGHDHLNNFSISYKGIRLSYGYSIDYLAYIGIWKKTEQRGCTMITVAANGTFDVGYELLVE